MPTNPTDTSKLEGYDEMQRKFLHLDIWVCGTFEVQAGKIVLFRDYFDLAEVTAKLVTGPFKKLLGLA